jgi:large subunit ribosomal protein L35
VCKIKFKSKSSAVKRFRVTGSGLVKHKQSHLRHLLSKKSSKRKRKLGTLIRVDYCDMASVKQLINYYK